MVSTTSSRTSKTSASTSRPRAGSPWEPFGRSSRWRSAAPWCAGSCAPDSCWRVTSKKHDIFENQVTGRRCTVARHADDIPRGTYLSILHDAGLADED